MNHAAIALIIEIEHQLETLKRLVHGTSGEPVKNVAEVIVIVAAEFGVSTNDILGHAKPRELVLARWTAIWISHLIWPSMTLAELDRRFKCKGGACSFGYSRLEEERSVYPLVRARTDLLLNRCLGEESAQLKLFKAV